eukprot:6491926-Amphidinium_carterae.1
MSVAPPEASTAAHLHRAPAGPQWRPTILPWVHSRPVTSPAFLSAPPASHVPPAMAPTSGGGYSGLYSSCL